MSPEAEHIKSSEGEPRLSLAERLALKARALVDAEAARREGEQALLALDAAQREAQEREEKEALEREQTRLAEGARANYDRAVAETSSMIEGKEAWQKRQTIYKDLKKQGFFLRDMDEAALRESARASILASLPESQREEKVLEEQVRWGAGDDQGQTFNPLEVQAQGMADALLFLREVKEATESLH